MPCVRAVCIREDAKGGCVVRRLDLPKAAGLIIDFVRSQHLRHPVLEVPTLPKLASLVPRSGSEGAEASIFPVGPDFLAAGAARIAINGAEIDHLKYWHRLMLMPALPVWQNIWGL